MTATNFAGAATYYFEQGHKYRSDADNFLVWLMESEEVRSRYRYRMHAFLPKETPWLHPADLLAWQWRLERSRHNVPGRRPPRADLRALIRDQDTHIDYSGSQLWKLQDALEVQLQRNVEAANLALSEGRLDELVRVRNLPPFPKRRPREPSE
jgi:hypothetical protein